MVAVEASPARFDQLVDEALASVPEQLLAAADNVVIEVADRDPEQPDLLGLYRGIALTDRDSDYSFALPDTITIYRLPLLAWCRDEQQLAEQIRVTVVHELAHHFGIDDHRLHELGWA